MSKWVHLKSSGEYKIIDTPAPLDLELDDLVVDLEYFELQKRLINMTIKSLLGINGQR